MTSNNSTKSQLDSLYKSGQDFLDNQYIDALQSGGPEPEPEGVVRSFSQETINEGRLHYVQSTANQTRDTFIFDVTNGISSLNRQKFHFTIIPKVIFY